MNTSAYHIILGEISPLLTEKGFATVTEGDLTRFVGESKAVSVSFDEEKKLFELRACGVSEGEPDGEWQVLSSWLFADDANEKDARSIGRDFYDSLLEELGIKPTVNKNKIAMPNKSAGGDTPTPEALTQRFLTLAPQYKNAYREHVAANGTCHYVEFLEETAVPHMRKLLEENNQKQLGKMMDMLDEIYCSGTKEATALVSYVFLGESIGDNVQLRDTALSYMEEHKYLAIALQNMFHRMKKAKGKTPSANKSNG